METRHHLVGWFDDAVATSTCSETVFYVSAHLYILNKCEFKHTYCTLAISASPFILFLGLADPCLRALTSAYDPPVYLRGSLDEVSAYPKGV